MKNEKFNKKVIKRIKILALNHVHGGFVESCFFRLKDFPEIFKTDHWSSNAICTLSDEKLIRYYCDEFDNIIKKDSKVKNKEIVNILKSEKSYDDKISLTLEHVKKESLQIWAVECAESVLHIFEEKYSNNKTVRECIEATKDYIDNLISKDELFEKRDAAYYAAYASACDAALVAYYVACAVCDATYDLILVSCGALATQNQQDQQDINLSLLIALIENEGD